MGNRKIEVHQMTLEDFQEAKKQRLVYLKKNNERNYDIQNDKFCIKLSGLSRKVTSADIYNFLSGINVKKMEIIKYVGRHSGNAFVKIDGADNLKVALGLNETAMGNRKIEVFQMTMADFYETRQIENQVDLEESKEAGIYKFCIKLSGLARKTTSYEISKYLSGNNVNHIDIIKPVDEKGRHSGDAFVMIRSDDDLKLSLRLSDTPMGNRQIEVCQISMEHFEEVKRAEVQKF